MTNPSPSACNICELPVSRKGPARFRLRRPDGGFDHAYCTLGISTYAFKDLDRSGPPRPKPQPVDRSGGWVRVFELRGGWMVQCRLCGAKKVKRTFMAADTNHAEAFRLATAFAARHRMSEMHAASLAVFHAEEQLEVSDADVLVAKILGESPPTANQLRRRMAAANAERLMRLGVGMVDA